MTAGWAGCPIKSAQPKGDTMSEKTARWPWRIHCSFSAEVRKVLEKLEKETDTPPQEIIRRCVERNLVSVVQDEMNKLYMVREAERRIQESLEAGKPID